MNQVAADVTDEPQQPQDQHYYQDCPQHISLSFVRSEPSDGAELTCSLHGAFTLPDEREHPLLWHGPLRPDVRAASKQ